MNTLTINTSSGYVNVRLSENSEFSVKASGEDIVKVYFTSKTPVKLGIGNSIVVFDRSFFINTQPIVKKTSSRLYEYECTFEAYIYDLSKVALLDVDATGVHFSHEFSLTGTLSTFATLIQTNLARVFGASKWYVASAYTYGDILFHKVKTLSFSEDSCLTALRKICNEFDTGYDIVEDDPDDFLLYLYFRDQYGYTYPTAFKYGKENGLYNIKRTISSSSNLTTRLYAFGGSKNLGANYRNFSTRLKLPENETSNLDNTEAIEKYGIIERVVLFDDIFPTREGTITTLGDSELKFIDSGMFDLNAMSGDNSLYLNGLIAKVAFNTGNLAGYEFEINNYDTATKTFTLNRIIDERSLKLPNADESAFQFNIGDKYVILDITLPQSYVDLAEQQLLEEAKDWLDKYSNEQVSYELDIDEKYVADNSISFRLNYNITIQDTDLLINETRSINEIRRNLVHENRYSIVLADKVYHKKTRQKSAKIDSSALVSFKVDPIDFQSDWDETSTDNPAFIKNKPEKATYTEINAGSETKKFITPKSLADSLFWTRNKAYQLWILGNKENDLDGNDRFVFELNSTGQKLKITYDQLLAELSDYFADLFGENFWEAVSTFGIKSTRVVGLGGEIDADENYWITIQDHEKAGIRVGSGNHTAITADGGSWGIDAYGAAGGGYFKSNDNPSTRHEIKSENYDGLRTVIRTVRKSISAYTPANGIGSLIEFGIENTGRNIINIAYIGARLTNATAGSEKGEIVFILGSTIRAMITEDFDFALTEGSFIVPASYGYNFGGKNNGNMRMIQIGSKIHVQIKEAGTWVTKQELG